MALDATLTLEDEIYDLYRKLLSDLPQGTAVLTRHRSKDPAGGEDIEVIPANPGSARISHHLGNDVIYTSIGRHTAMEFWVSSRRQEEQELEQLRRISRAVIEGKFREDVWKVNGKVVKSRAIIEIDGRREGIGGFLTFFNPLRRKQRQHFEYAPYVSSGHGKLGNNSF
jgi:hypothetical protein